MTEARDPEPAASVERRIVTVLFADLVGFTPLSERLDAEDVATIQDAYFAAARETITRYGGVLEKFIGDAAMAVFGTPVARDDDAGRAVRAGLALIGSVEQLGTRLGLEAGELQLRVGVNSGEVVHATSGPDAGRVTGDTVNTAARLQASARPGTVLLGELTALTVAETIETEAVGPIEMKGKADPVRCWEAVAPRPAPSREEALGALRSPMLGRDDELRRLLAAVEEVQRDWVASRILVVAPPGVGKSRLLAELASVVSVTVRRARVRPQATAPYETVSQLIGSIEPGVVERALEGAGVPASRAAVVLAEVRRLRGAETATAAALDDLAAERETRFDAWLAALDATSPDAELWLVEDVHWAGGDLLAFLDHAGRAPTRHGRLIVTTARPSLLEAAPAWCATRRLELAPLPPADAAALVTSLLGIPLPERLVDAIVERSDGTPLFIEELLRTWASVGTLARDAEGWHLAVEPDAVPLPATVQAIYAAQLDDLPPAARLLARRGAVAGRRVPVDALGALEVDDSEGLEQLHRRALLTGPVDDPVTGQAYVYRHALLRDAGYASLARAERSRLHLAMAGWLESVAGDRADVVAEAIAEHHALALESLPALAGDGLPDRRDLASSAATWYERAAEAALRLAAPDAAVRLFRRALVHSTSSGPSELARRHRRLGEVLAASAELDAGIRELEAALAVATGDQSELAASAYATARAYMQQIRFPEAERMTSETLDLLGDAALRLRTPLRALHAWAVAAQGRSDGVLEEAESAWADARSVGDPALELEVLEHVTAARDEVDAASPDMWVELDRRARQLGRWQQVVVAGRILAVHEGLDEPEKAIAALVDVADLGRAHGLTEQAAWCDYTRCELLWVIGRWDEALALGEDVLSLAERFAYERLAFRTWVVVLPMVATRGLGTLVERYDAWWAVAHDHFPVNVSPYGRLLTAAIAVWRRQALGQPVAAPSPDVVDAVVPMMNAHFLAGIEAVIGAWMQTGRRDLAEAAADRMLGAEDATPIMRASRMLVEAWVGRAAAADAVRTARSVGAPWWLARALRAAGEDAEAAVLESGLGIARAT